MEKAAQTRRDDGQLHEALSRQPRASSQPAFVDHRPAAAAQRALADGIKHSPKALAQSRQLKGLLGSTAQLAGGAEDEELQMKASPGAAVLQMQQTDVCLKSASGTYDDAEGVQKTFDFKEGAKGSDVIANTKSHPNAMQDKEALAEAYLKKQREIPKTATNVVFTDCTTYGIKK